MLQLSTKCWISAFNAQGLRLIIVVVQVRAVKIYVAPVEALRKKERQVKLSLPPNWWFSKLQSYSVNLPVRCLILEKREARWCCNFFGRIGTCYGCFNTPRLARIRQLEMWSSTSKQHGQRAKSVVHSKVTSELQNWSCETTWIVMRASVL